MESSESPATKADIAAAVDAVKSYVREQVLDAETKLLRAFADHNGATTIRFRKLEADVSKSMPPGHSAWL